MEEKKETQTGEPNWISRNLIAFIITVFILGITIVIALFILRNPQTGTDGKLHIDLTFIGQTLLPLWSTWIGTVLAFYFGKANFEAGTRSYQEALKLSQTPEEKIAKLAVKDIMLPVKDIVFLDYETELPNSLSAILSYPQFEPYNRFAVLDKNKVVKYMIHRGTIYEFLYARYEQLKKGGQPADTDQIKLEELINSPDEKFKRTLTRGFGFVAFESNLLDAKRIMDATDECTDVFVTQNGKPTESILGLITNTRIFQNAKV